MLLLTAIFALGLLLARIVGMMGLAPIDSWPAAARWGFATLFVFTGAAHFAPRLKRDMINMTPRWVPGGERGAAAMVAFTGVCEIAGGAGLVTPLLQQAAAIGLIAMLVAIFPANVRAAREQIPIAGRPATPLWIRGPMQAAMIAGVAWAGLIAST